MKRQPQLDVVSPSSELNLRELELNAQRINKGSRMSLVQRDSRQSSLEPGETSTIRKSCTAPSSAPTADRSSPASSIPSSSLTQAKVSLTSIPDPPKSPAPKSPLHDYMNFKNGSYEQDITSSKYSNQSNKCNDVNSTTMDYVNTTLQDNQSRDGDQPLSPELTTDLSAFEKSHSHLLTEEWNIDREIPRKKKHASSSSTFDRLDA